MKKFISFFLVLSLGLTWVPAFGADDSGPPSDRISMKTARATALRKFPGKVRDFEFEIRKHKWVYFFKIAGKDQKFHNIVVDAVTGKIISKTSEPIPMTTKELVTPTPLAENSGKN
ncbi:MAG TPA: PepSY domain-containing protein [bacterium]